MYIKNTSLIPCVSLPTTHFSAHVTANLFVTFDGELTHVFHTPVSFDSESTVGPDHHFIEISLNEIPNEFCLNKTHCQIPVLFLILHLF